MKRFISITNLTHHTATRIESPRFTRMLERNTRRAAIIEEIPSEEETLTLAIAKLGSELREIDEQIDDLSLRMWWDRSEGTARARDLLRNRRSCTQKTLNAYTARLSTIINSTAVEIADFFDHAGNRREYRDDRAGFRANYGSRNCGRKAPKRFTRDSSKYDLALAA